MIILFILHLDQKKQILYLHTLKLKKKRKSSMLYFNLYDYKYFTKKI